MYDAAVSGTAVPAPPLLTACTRCCVLVSSCWIRRYPLLFLVAVLSVRCCVPLSSRLVRGYATTHRLHTLVCSWVEGGYGGICSLLGCCFELEVPATPQLVVRIRRGVWHGGTRSP
jgi:hypothetical protein